MTDNKDSNNDKISVDQYGRKTWNVEAYAKEAKNKQYKKNPSTTNVNTSIISSDKPSSYLAHREKLLKELLSAINQHTIINPLNTSSYGKNKKFGFVCQICDLSFRDNLALIDHINSPLHVQRSLSLLKDHGGEESEKLDGGVRRATTDEVRVTLESLIAKLAQEKNAGENSSDIKERIMKRQAFEEQQRVKRREKRAKTKKLKKEQNINDDTNNTTNNDLASMMGFGGFGSTKK